MLEQLNPRLRAAAELVRPGQVVADVGTDHGQLICALVESGRCPKGYACDINPKPLARAAEEIRSRGLEDRIATVLTDGLDRLPQEEIGDFVVAGLGGDLIGEIITAQSWTRNPDKHFILQPMSKADHLRRILCANGFAIRSETAVRSGRFVYTVLSVRYEANYQEISDLFAYTGKLWYNLDEVSSRYLSKVLESLEKRAAGLREAAVAAEADRYGALALAVRRRLEDGRPDHSEGGDVEAPAEGAPQPDMLTVGDFYAAVDRLAPFATAEGWDNVGLLVGSPRQRVARVLLALDVTGPVVEEAAGLGAGLIISHHPVIFSPLKRLDSSSVVYRLAAAGISVISAHTNLDMAPGGVNDALARKLGLICPRPLAVVDRKPFYKLAVGVPLRYAEQVYEAMSAAGAGRLGNYSHCGLATDVESRFKPLDGSNPAIGSVGRLEKVREVLLEMLVPPDLLDGVLAALRAAHPYEVPAFDLYENHAVEKTTCLGVVGELRKSCSPEALAELVKERLNAPGVRYRPGSSSISTVAVLGGSGGDYLNNALSAGAQAYLTADLKHHHWLKAGEAGITLLDGGHHATEAVTLEPLRRQLLELLPGADLLLSQVDGDGTKYI